jgi:hypothetical protein
MAKLKIPAPLVAQMETAFRQAGPMVAVYRERIAQDARVRDPAMRLRWDLLHASMGSRWICDSLYTLPGVNDNHIDSALREIMRRIGED